MLLHRCNRAVIWIDRQLSDAELDVINETKVNPQFTYQAVVVIFNQCRT